MTKQMNVNVLKSLMNQSGWTHEQVITINNEYDEMVEGIAEVVSRNPSAPFEIHYNEGFKYNVEKDEPGFGGSHLSLKSLIKTEKKSTLGI